MLFLIKNSSIFDVGSNQATTVVIDDALYEKALEMADPDMVKADLFR